jgi:hypothetical protein
MNADRARALLEPEALATRLQAAATRTKVF